MKNIRLFSWLREALRSSQTLNYATFFIIQCSSKSEFQFLNIYILNVIVYDKAVILVAVHFSMQNIELLRNLGRASGRAMWASACNVLWLYTFASHRSHISMTLSAGNPPPGCSKPFVKWNLIPNIRKRIEFKCKVRADNELIIQNIAIRIVIQILSLHWMMKNIRLLSCLREAFRAFHRF